LEIFPATYLKIPKPITIRAAIMSVVTIILLISFAVQQDSYLGRSYLRGTDSFD